MSAHLQKVQKALEDLTKQKFRSTRQAVRAHGISKSTVAHRLQGCKSRAQSHSLMGIAPAQEVLVRWLEGLQRQILTTNHATVRGSVVQLLLENDDLEPLGMRWTTRFLRHPLLEISYGRAIDIQQLLALDSSTITTLL
jgi:hypothetical protein